MHKSMKYKTSFSMTHVSTEMHFRNSHEVGTFLDFYLLNFQRMNSKYDSIESIFIPYVSMYFLSHSLLLIHYCLR